MSVKDPVVERIRGEMVDYLKSQDAFWTWQGHKHVAELASGKLSDFFANLSPLFTNVYLQERIGWALVYKAFNGDSAALQHDNLWVMGSAMGAIGLAQSVARAVHAYNPNVRSGFTESDYHPEGARMHVKRFNLGKDPRVILCEDVMTTGYTTEKTINGIRKNNPDAVYESRVLVAVDRRPDPCHNLLDFDVISLMRVQPCTWNTVDDLPADMKNCVPLRPKANWHKLATEML